MWVSTDVVYYDFSNAFDSVNHDLILKKLKMEYKIDGRLPKFIMTYLRGREQSAVIHNCKSSNKPVLSGVPQGSIIHHRTNTFRLVYRWFTARAQPKDSDGPVCWQHKNLEIDCQRKWSWNASEGYDYLNEWARSNKMKFHPMKCKVVSIHNRPSPLAMLPFHVFNIRWERVNLIMQRMKKI
jgi:hypothetical protein